MSPLLAAETLAGCTSRPVSRRPISTIRSSKLYYAAMFVTAGRHSHHVVHTNISTVLLYNAGLTASVSSHRDDR